MRRIPGQLAVVASGLIPPGLLGHEPGRRIYWPAAHKEMPSSTIELTGMLNSAYEGPYAPVDRLIERGRTESEPEIRHDIYREIEEIIVKRTLLLPLFHEKSYCFTRPEVEGFDLNFFSPIIPFEKLWIRERR